MNGILAGQNCQYHVHHVKVGNGIKIKRKKNNERHPVNTRKCIWGEKLFRLQAQIDIYEEQFSVLQRANLIEYHNKIKVGI